jgi:hypothetical protein
MSASSSASSATRQAPDQFPKFDVESATIAEAMCGRRLETAGNMLCHAPSDAISTVKVVFPLSDRDGEAWRLDALGRRVAAERELTLRTVVRERSITFIFSNRV